MRRKSFQEITVLLQKVFSEEKSGIETYYCLGLDMYYSLICFAFDGQQGSQNETIICGRQSEKYVKVIFSVSGSVIL